MSFLNDFLNEVKDDITAIASDSFAGYLEEIKNDAGSFIKTTSSDINRWLKMVKTGGLTDREFAFLLKGKTDQMKLFALEEAGLHVVKKEAVRNKILNVIARGSLSLLSKGLF